MAMMVRRGVRREAYKGHATDRGAGADDDERARGGGVVCVFVGVGRNCREGGGKPKPEVGWKSAMKLVTAFTGRLTTWSSVKSGAVGAVAAMSSMAYCWRPG